MRFNKDLEPLIDLWIRVIKRAVDDLVLFSGNESDPDRETYDSAYSFIFSDEHTIFIDNYWVRYECKKCERFVHEMMSSFSSSYKCNNCNAPIKGEDVEISELMKYLNRECLATELFEMLGIEDITGFRKKVKEIVKAKTGREI